MRKKTHVAWCVDLAANAANISEKNSGVAPRFHFFMHKGITMLSG